MSSSRLLAMQIDALVAFRQTHLPVAHFMSRRSGTPQLQIGMTTFAVFG